MLGCLGGVSVVLMLGGLLGFANVHSRKKHSSQCMVGCLGVLDVLSVLGVLPGFPNVHSNKGRAFSAWLFAWVC